MRPTATLALLVLILGAAATALAHESQGGAARAPAAAATEAVAPLLETLMKAQLARVEGTEVIMSRVTLPPNVSLPKHWHPGEEFAYVIEGSVILWQEGEEDRSFEAGEAVRIPLRRVHTAITKDEGATLLVFRVHEQGQPERVLVD